MLLFYLYQLVLCRGHCCVVVLFVSASVVSRPLLCCCFICIS